MNAPASVPGAQETAGLLLDAGCVAMHTGEPFRLPSGWASPAYMDCRRLISYPLIRHELVSRGLALLKERRVLGEIDSVAGGESSGIALAAWIAEALDLPLQYVRKRGLGQHQIEGVLHPGDRVLLVDDMMAAGQSKLRFYQALKGEGAQVRDLFVLFDYGTFPTAQTLGPLGLHVHALCTWRDVLAVATQRAAFAPAALAELRDFIDNPSLWSQNHGGIGAAPNA